MLVVLFGYLHRCNQILQPLTFSFQICALGTSIYLCAFAKLVCAVVYFDGHDVLARFLPAWLQSSQFCFVHFLLYLFKQWRQQCSNKQETALAAPCMWMRQPLCHLFSFFASSLFFLFFWFLLFVAVLFCTRTISVFMYLFISFCYLSLFPICHISTHTRS